MTDAQWLLDKADYWAKPFPAGKAAATHGWVMHGGHRTTLCGTLPGGQRSPHPLRRTVHDLMAVRLCTPCLDALGYEQKLIARPKPCKQRSPVTKYRPSDKGLWEQPVGPMDPKQIQAARDAVQRHHGWRVASSLSLWETLAEWRALCDGKTTLAPTEAQFEELEKEMEAAMRRADEDLQRRETIQSLRGKG